MTKNRETVHMTVGEAIVKFLDNQYVLMEVDGKLQENKFIDYFYTVFGHGCVLGVGAALSQTCHGMQVMQGKNEQGMAHAAISYAKMHNRLKIIPCLSSVGPGSANMVTAAATATVNNLPLLLLLGDTFATRQPDPVLQQVEQPHNLTVTTNDAFRPVTKYFDRITRPEMIYSALLNAMRVLTSPQDTGAVALALCQDVQGESFEFDKSFLQKRVHFITRPIPDQYQIEQAAQAILQSKKPLVIVGGGVRYSQAGKEVGDFCSKHNIPFAETQSGKSAIAGSHKLNLGGIGVTGNSCANTIAKDADLIIGLGTRFSDFTTSSKWLYANAEVVTINVSAFHANKLDSIAVIADILQGIKALDTALGNYTTTYTHEIDNAKAIWAQEMDRLRKIEFSENFVPENKTRVQDSLQAFYKVVGGNICQTTALGLIRERIADDAVIVGAAGSLPGCLQRMWTTDSIGSYNMEYGYSCMGYEIAGAFGAKLACPDKEVYALLGDGSYNMLHSEMLTAIQERKKINILLFDNASFGCINNLQMTQGVNALCTEFRYREDGKPIRDGEFVNIDYAMCARGYGFVTYTAKTMEELEKAIMDSKKQTKPTLIDIKVLPKTMTDGYGGWWNVGCLECPLSESGVQALMDKRKKLIKARHY